MVYNPNANNQPKRDFFQDLLVPNSKLTIVKPSTNKRTVIRIYPEFKDGKPLPMVIGQMQNADGSVDYQFSNLYIRPTVVMAGSLQKFTGFADPKHNEDPRTDPVDLAALNDFTMPWRALYPVWKGKFNKHELAGDELALFQQLTTKPQNSGAPLSQIQDNVLVQCGVIVLNGETLAQPKLGCAVLLTKTGFEALLKTLSDAARRGQDLYDFQNGVQLEIKGEGKNTDTQFGVGAQRPNGSKPREFEVNVLGAMPIPAQDYFIPYEGQVREYTYDEHIHLMVKAFGARVVAKVPAFADAMARLGIPMSAQTVSQPTAQPAPQAAPSSSWGVTPVAAPAAAPVATSGWGTAPAAAPAPQAWAQPATAPAVAEATPPASPTLPTAASKDAIRAEYEKLLKPNP
jgi:hypothetical protein